ncbi:hypothetical protein FGF62_01385 [Neisseria meningitidis]|uniref:hypothetical protein n=1 Tax=Neisseria meningitidis TaxID=487 RepID=UPI001F5C5CF3|nr:hypothetical protein [Neisseria meningitidis]MCI3162177.1 hypothetical protein [Neisseria meningitidis]
MHQYTYLDYNFKTNELNQYPYISFFIILCLALAQRERFSKVLKHQVNRFRTICTVCGFVAFS